MDTNFSVLFLQNRIADGSVSLLDLSPRALNMLRLNNISSLRQLSALNVEVLENLEYSTRQIAQEILFCLSDYLHDPQNILPESENNPQIADIQQKENSVFALTEKAIPIEKLGLSVRSFNCLKRVGLHTLQDLIGKTEEELLQIRNLGSKSAIEIVEVVKAYLSSPHEEEAITEESQSLQENAEQETVPDNRPIEVLNLSVRSYNVLKRAEIHTVQQLLDMKREALSELRNLGRKSLEELESVRKNYSPPIQPPSKTDYTVDELKSLIMDAYQEPYHGLSWQEFRDTMPEVASDELIKQAVGTLLAEGKLEYVDFRCYRVYPSFYEYYKNNLDRLDDRKRAVLVRRYAGETLDSIGTALGITRERVRQIFKSSQGRYMRIIKNACMRETGSSIFAEDFYETLYTSCALPDEFWIEELGLHPDSINYLENSFTRGTKNPEEILHNEEIPVSLRYRVRSFLDREKIRLDGKLFPKNRSVIEDYAMQKYAQDEISFERFTELYNGMLEDNDIPFDEKIYYTESVVHTRINRLGESRNCLWKQGARLRWYDIDARDYTELLETLNLGSYQNTEVSTRKFMHQFPDTMEDYDIRDPYELHNLLKKISKQYALDFVDFSRQPILQFGEFNRLEAIKEAMIALSPVTQQDLIDYLYLEYGYDKLTMVGYLSPLSAYYHNGIYSVDFKQIPEQRIKLLRAALTEDFYYLDELKHIYKKLFPDADQEELNPYSLKALGFVVNSNYAIQHYPSAGAYFSWLLTKEDVFDISPLLQRYGSITMFTQTYAELLKSHQLFRYGKNQIISARRLARLNVTEELIKDYCTSVKAFAEEDSYFTVYSLRQDGFAHKLDMLGLSDYFYASLLASDERFSSCSIFNELVLYNGSQAQQLSRADFLLTQLQGYDSVDPDEFMQDIKNGFGIAIPDRYEVTGAVKDTELYYDSIMDKIYRDKSFYYADIDE